MPQNAHLATPKDLNAALKSGDTDAPTPFFSSTALRWVGGSVGYVYHTGNARFVGGCAGSVRGF